MYLPFEMTTLTLVGDMMLSRTFDTHPVYPWDSSVLDILKGTLLCGNLETAVTTSTEKWPNKVFNYKVTPKIFAQLLPPEKMVFNLANNHTLDFKKKGLEETIATLETLDIPYMGLTMKPTLLAYGGLKFGFLGISDQPIEWKGQGINYFDIENDDWDPVLTDVKAAADQVDVLVIYLHYGPNWVPAIPELFKQWNRALIDAGATIVAGTSPHHLLPVEAYGKGVIFYSLGDICDDYQVDLEYRNDLTMLAQVTFDKEGHVIKNEAYPAKIEDMTVRLLSRNESDYDWVVQHLK